MTDGLEAARVEVRSTIIRYPGAIPAGALMKLEKAVREDELASASALRAAAQEAATLAENIAAHIDDLGGSGGDTVRTIASMLESALDGAPWEPSEGMVERLGYWLATRDGEALSYEWGRDGTGPDGGVYRDYTTEARAALKAGMGIESGSAG